MSIQSTINFNAGPTPATPSSSPTTSSANADTTPPSPTRITSPQGTASSAAIPETGNSDWHWQEPPGGPTTLFDGGNSGTPQASDIEEGSLNDCFYMVDLEAMAKTNPSLIKNNIRELTPADGSQPGVYQVTLYQPNGTPVNIDVNSDELVDGQGNQLTNRSTQALWPMLYEKAYAVYQGQDMNTALNQEGWPQDPWQTLTNQPDPAAFSVMPTQAGAFASAVGSDSSGNITPTIVAVRPISDVFPNGQSTFPDPNYTVTANAQKGLFYVTDKATHEQWTIPQGHAMLLSGLSSTGTDKNPLTADDEHLNLNLSNPWGASATNTENLQGLPYDVAKYLLGGYYTIPPAQGANDG